MGVHHFGAFFDRPSRERDYLWGRIDGCCQLIALVIDSASASGGASGGIAPTALMRRACVAVLEEEWHHVPGCA